MKHLQFGWDFDLRADFSHDIANEIEKQLRQKFVKWNTQLGQQYGTSFCAKADCSDVTILVTDYSKDFRVKIDVDGLA